MHDNAIPRDNQLLNVTTYVRNRRMHGSRRRDGPRDSLLPSVRQSTIHEVRRQCRARQGFLPARPKSSIATRRPDLLRNHPLGKASIDNDGDRLDKGILCLNRGGEG